MHHNEFVEEYEAEGMELQAEEIEENEWQLLALDRDGAIVGKLAVSKDVVQELYAAGRLTRSWEPES